MPLTADAPVSGSAVSAQSPAAKTPGTLVRPERSTRRRVRPRRRSRSSHSTLGSIPLPTTTRSAGEQLAVVEATPSRAPAPTISTGVATRADAEAVPREQRTDAAAGLGVHHLRQEVRRAEHHGDRRGRVRAAPRTACRPTLPPPTTTAGRPGRAELFDPARSSRSRRREDAGKIGARHAQALASRTGGDDEPVEGQISAAISEEQSPGIRSRVRSRGRRARPRLPASPSKILGGAPVDGVARRCVRRGRRPEAAASTRGSCVRRDQRDACTAGACSRAASQAAMPAAEDPTTTTMPRKLALRLDARLFARAERARRASHHAGRGVPVRAHVAAHHPVPRRIERRMPKGHTIRHMEQPTQRSSSSTMRPVDGIA